MKGSSGYRNRAMSRRSFLTLGGTGLMGVTLLGSAACGSGSNGSGELSFLISGGDDPNSQELWDELMPRFRDSHQEIKIERSTVSWDAAHSEIFNRIRANDAPDLMLVGSRWIPEFASLNNGIRSIDEYITEDIREKFYPSVVDTAMVGDELYGALYGYSTKALIYRTDLIEKPPKNWQELVEVAKGVQEENSGISGIGISAADHVSTADQFSQFVFQNDGQIFDDEGAVAFDNELGVEALSYYVDFHREHEVTPNPVEYNREELPTLFQTGRIAMMLIGPWGGPDMGLEPDNDEVPYAAAPLPMGRRMATELVTDSIVMSSSASDPDAAGEFLRWFERPEILAEKDYETGSVPLMPEELEAKPRLEEEPYFQTFIDMADHGVSSAKPALWQPFEEIVVDMVQKTMLGDTSPEQAIREAAQAIRDEQLEPRAVQQG